MIKKLTMKKLLLTGIAALFLATGPTPAPAQDCDYNSPSYFKCKESQEKHTPWLNRCSFPHTPNGFQLDWSEQCCKRWPNAPNCNGDWPPLSGPGGMLVQGWRLR